MSIEEISRMLDSPLGNLWIVFLENQFTRCRGNPASGGENINTFLAPCQFATGSQARSRSLINKRV